jgi:hypothetical protein
MSVSANLEILAGSLAALVGYRAIDSSGPRRPIEIGRLSRNGIRKESRKRRVVRIGETWSALFSPTHEPYDVRYRGRQAKPFGSSQNGLGDDALAMRLKGGA